MDLVEEAIEDGEENSYTEIAIGRENNMSVVVAYVNASDNLSTYEDTVLVITTEGFADQTYSPHEGKKVFEELKQKYELLDGEEREFVSRLTERFK